MYVGIVSIGSEFPTARMGECVKSPVGQIHLSRGRMSRTAPIGMESIPHPTSGAINSRPNELPALLREVHGATVRQVQGVHGYMQELGLNKLACAYYERYANSVRSFVDVWKSPMVCTSCGADSSSILTPETYINPELEKFIKDHAHWGEK